jgi:predicted transcriptional regulator of viral defense system
MNLDLDQQHTRAVAVLAALGMAHLHELTEAGIAEGTVFRLEEQGEIVCLASGLYQLAEAPLDVHHSLAEAAKLVPDGIICGPSALSFHDLTDRIPRLIWMTIPDSISRPRDITAPPIHFVAPGTSSGVEIHEIEGIPVRVYCAAKAVVEEFRTRRYIAAIYHKDSDDNDTPATECLKNALRRGKATRAEMENFAREAGPVTEKNVRDFLSAFAVCG